MPATQAALASLRTDKDRELQAQAEQLEEFYKKARIMQVGGGAWACVLACVRVCVWGSRQAGRGSPLFSGAMLQLQGALPLFLWQLPARPPVPAAPTYARAAPTAAGPTCPTGTPLPQTASSIFEAG